MTKELQEIMNRSRLRNKSLCFRSEEFFNNVVKELKSQLKKIGYVMFQIVMIQ